MEGEKAGGVSGALHIGGRETAFGGQKDQETGTEGRATEEGSSTELRGEIRINNSKQSGSTESRSFDRTRAKKWGLAVGMSGQGEEARRTMSKKARKRG